MSIRSIDTITLTTSAEPPAGDAFQRAARLVADELGGVVITATTTCSSTGVERVRERKLTLTRAVARSSHISSLTDAFRVVDAAYPFFSPGGRCTEDAVTAACGPLYGGLALYQTSTQRMLRTQARRILTRAIAAVEGQAA